MKQLTDKGIGFGFLREGWAIEFEYGKIEPLDDFVEVRNSVMKLVNADGYFYPPETRLQTTTSGSKWRTIPKTKRPAHTYHVPSSHRLYLNLPKPEPDVHDGSAAFILHLVAFFFRTRLQFADWLSDGRIPLNKTRDRNVATPAHAGKSISHCHRLWLNWPNSVKRRFTSILYMFSRAESYEWDWEEFIIEYMILDALWKCATELFGLKSNQHAKRVEKLLAHFSITLEPGFLSIRKMVQMRNDLLHEALWFDSRPGSTNCIQILPYYMPMRMCMLNQMLITRFFVLT